MKHVPLLVVLLAVVSLAACSSAPYAKKTQDRLQAYTAAAGAPVNNFGFYPPIYSWEPLSNTQLVVYTKPKQAYFIDLAACVNLQVTTGIGLTSNSNQVAVGFDKVIPFDTHTPCTIAKIRPIDMVHLKAVQQAQRKIEQRPRPEPSQQ